MATEQVRSAQGTSRGRGARRAGFVRAAVVLALVICSIGGVVAAGSRGGLLVASGALVVAIAILLGWGGLALDRRGWLAITVVVLGSVSVATFGGWQALKRLQRSQREYPTGVDKQLSDFTLRCELLCLPALAKGRQVLMWLRAESLLPGDTSLSLQLEGDNLTFAISKYRVKGGAGLRTSASAASLVGKLVELLLIRSNSQVNVWANGVPVAVTAFGAASFWTNALDASSLVIPPTTPRSPSDGQRLLRRITLFDAALTPTELAPDLSSSATPSAKAAVPVFDLTSMQMDRPAALQAQLRSRHLIHEAGRHIAGEHRWLGTGPGTFASVYAEYRREHPRASRQSYAHNDWLETRITFGRVGFVLLLASLACATLAWRLPGGVPVPPVCLALVGIALVGCLVHAGFDYPLQTPPVLLQFLVGAVVLSAANCRRAKFPVPFGPAHGPW